MNKFFMAFSPHYILYTHKVIHIVFTHLDQIGVNRSEIKKSLTKLKARAGLYRIQEFLA